MKYIIKCEKRLEITYKNYSLLKSSFFRFYCIASFIKIELPELSLKSFVNLSVDWVVETVHGMTLNPQPLVQLQMHSRQLNNILRERRSLFLGTESAMDRLKMSKPETGNKSSIYNNIDKCE